MIPFWQLDIRENLLTVTLLPKPSPTVLNEHECDVQSALSTLHEEVIHGEKHSPDIEAKQIPTGLSVFKFEMDEAPSLCFPYTFYSWKGD